MAYFKQTLNQHMWAYSDECNCHDRQMSLDDIRMSFADKRVSVADKRMSQKVSGHWWFIHRQPEAGFEEVSQRVWRTVRQLVRRRVFSCDLEDGCHTFKLVPRRMTGDHLNHRTAKTPAHNNYFSSTSPSTTTSRNDTKLAPRTLPIRAYPKKTVAIPATFTNQKSKRLPDNSRFTTISK